MSKLDGPEKITVYSCGKCKYKLIENGVASCTDPTVIKAHFGEVSDEFGKAVMATEPHPCCLIVRGLV